MTVTAGFWAVYAILIVLSEQFINFVTKSQKWPSKNSII